jgi:hypothetical protein
MARILLAEDDAATAWCTRAPPTAQVVVAGRRRGPGKLRGGDFDLLISDADAGSTASAGRRGLARHPNCVVLMSGFAGELGRADHLKGRISRIITKPFTLEQIRAAAKAALA